MTRQDFDQIIALRQEIYQCGVRIAQLRQKLQPLKTADTVRGSSPIWPYTKRVFRLEGAVDPANAKHIRRQLQQQVVLLEALRGRCEQERTRLMEEVGAVADSQTRQILTLRYVEGRSWTAVAQLLGGGNTADGVRMQAKRHFENMSVL